MADEETTGKPTPEPAPEPEGRRARRVRRTPAPETPADKPAPAEEREAKTRVPKRADLPSDLVTLLSTRRALARRRPIFGRQQANRYRRIGRDGTWRRPRGLQSKQRRHYGYRPKIVRIGYRSPARVRGLVPSGFRPVLVHTVDELEALDGRTQAAVIARRVGTRRRLTLEEEARKLGIRVLNPIVEPEEES